jgi:hypothetical protein
MNNKRKMEKKIIHGARHSGIPVVPALEGEAIGS